MISISLFALAAILNALSDVIDDFYGMSRLCSWFGIFNQFWNPSLSWQNKWEWDKDGNKIGERFLGSSTLLVAFTDAWHLAKMLMLASIIGAIVSYTPLFIWWLDIPIYTTVWFLVFEGSYRWLKKEI